MKRMPRPCTLSILPPVMLIATMLIAAGAFAPPLRAQGTIARQAGEAAARVEIAPNPGAGSITAAAGDTILFTFTAKDAGGGVITDWNATGDTVFVELLGSWANRDTANRSWNADADGYTFAVLAPPAVPAWQDAWALPPSAFTAGVARIAFVHTAAQSGVFLQMHPVTDTTTQRSPAMSFTAGPAASVLLDITSQVAGSDAVYRFRPHELAVYPRDRYMNALYNGTLTLRFAARFPGEYDSTTPGLSKIFSRDVTVNGPAFYTLSALQARAPGVDQLHAITVQGVTDPNVAGATDEYGVLDHAPAAPQLTSPISHHDHRLDSYTDSLAFRWTVASPADAFTNIRVSRTNGTRSSDTLHYTVVICDSATGTPRAHRDVRWRGANYRSLSAEEAAELVDIVAGASADTAHIIWYVEVTDGNYTSVSTPPHQDPAGQPGFYLHLIRPAVAPRPWVEISRNTLATPIDATVGEPVAFTLTARTADGRTKTDWNSTGAPVRLLLKKSTAEVDTSQHSWNADTAGYSWTRMDPPAVKTDRDTWIVPASAFTDGVAQIAFTQTRAETGVYLLIDSAFVPKRQTSARMHFHSDSASNYLVDLTSQTWPNAGAYVNRPYEIVVIPRDRYLNAAAAPVVTQFSAAYPAEFDTAAYGASNLFGGPRTVNGTTPIRLVSTALRADQVVMAQAAGDPSIAGVSDPYALLPHAPAPFGLLDPPTGLVVSSFPSLRFTWLQSTDPFRDVMISRYAPQLLSDTPRYTVVFRDSATLTRSVRMDADAQGYIPQLTMTREMAADLVEQITGDSLAAVADVVWHVEATDGDSVRMSSPPYRDTASAPGFVIHIEKPPIPHARMQLAAPWTGPALDTSAGVTLVFTVDVKDLQGQAIPDWNANGYPVDVTLRSTANSDSSTRSWSADPDGYTFARLALVGTTAQAAQTGSHRWSIPPAAFTQGRARLALTDSKAERDVTLTVSHTGIKDSWQAESAPMHFAAGRAASLLVDVSSQASGADRVFCRRPHELILVVRDAHMNPVEDSLVLVCTAARPAEFDSSAGGGSMFIPGEIGLRGTTHAMLVSTDTTTPGRLQQITVQVKGDASLAGASRRYAIAPHAPYPVSLLGPDDHAVIDVAPSPSAAGAVFAWSSVVPPDPFTGIRVSRVDGTVASDIVRATVVFEDNAGQALQVRVPARNDGRGSTAELTAGELRGIGDAIMQRGDWTSCPVRWYVESSDGIYTTRSGGIRYATLRPLTTGAGDPRAAVAVATLDQNYPNPVTGAGATTIAFSLRSPAAVIVKLYSPLGVQLATLAEGELAPGIHRVTFQTRSLPAGVYVYTLRAGGTLLTRRLTVLP